jgi:MFS family permease
VLAIPVPSPRRLGATLGRFGIHYAWIICAVTFLAMLTASAVRSMPGVLLLPLEMEFGWDRASITVAVSIALLLHGGTGPIFGRLVDRAGPRLVASASVALMSLGALGTILMTEVWQFDLFWGLVVGGASGGIGSVLTASVVNRWFQERRGLAAGILGTAHSTGQIIFIPVMMWLAVTAGWRAGVLLAAALLGLMVLPLIFLLFRNDPADIGLAPFGESKDAATQASQAALRAESTPMSQVVRTPDFWWLVGTFWVCGYTTNGLVGTHFISHAAEHGIGEVTAAGIFGLMGGVNMLGTIASGMLADRVQRRRILLASYYGFRGVSLFFLPFIQDPAMLMIFGILYGLNWFATAPVSQVLTGDLYGRRSVGQVYGWIFFSHQVGGATAAFLGGLIHVWFGSYQVAFISAGLAGLMAAGFALQLNDRGRARVATAAPA